MVFPVQTNDEAFAPHSNLSVRCSCFASQQVLSIFRDVCWLNAEVYVRRKLWLSGMKQVHNACLVFTVYFMMIVNITA